MKKFLGNFVLAVIIGAVPAYFGSAITGDIQYEGCIKGITYYNPKTSENGYGEDICGDAIEHQEYIFTWWILTTLITLFVIYKIPPNFMDK